MSLFLNQSHEYDKNSLKIGTMCEHVSIDSGEKNVIWEKEARVH